MAETTPNTPVSKIPGDDVMIGGAEGQLTLLTALRAYKLEGDESKRTRMQKNRENVNAYLSIQDWSHKNEGQSREFLPKTSVAVEQLVGFIKRALTQFGAYYDVELPLGSESPISGTTIRNLMNCSLDSLLVGDNKIATFPLQMSDGIKTGALESLCIFKVHGNMFKSPVFRLEPGDEELGLVQDETETWKLRIDLIDPKNYGVDPTGAGLYEYHTIEKDLHKVIEMAEEGIYDKAAVARIEEDFRMHEEDKRQRDQTGQDDAQKPGFRKKVVITEFWCNIIDNAGKMVHRNVFCATANDKYIIRKPTKNPFWHGRSPFVAIPLIRVPFTEWHKAMFDDAAQLNFAMNEIFNLIIDGGISAVWGIKQVRIDDMEDPSQASGGFPQGETIAVKSTLPHGQKVLEKVAEGEVPGDAMAVLEMLSREFAAAALSSELKMGSLPAKQVRATEIIELSQSQAITLDGIIGDIEQMMTKVLDLIWLTILQNIDDFSGHAILNAIGPRAAFAIGSMSPAERFKTFANNPCAFKVHGLSAMLSRTRDFQKFMALLQAVTTNPLLFQAFFKKYSPDKVLNHMMKMLGINPERIEKDDAEIRRLDQDLSELMQLSQFVQGPAGGGAQAAAAGTSGQSGGGDPTTAEISAVGNPTAGLAGVGNT
jgi:hypothetical protein